MSATTPSTRRVKEQLQGFYEQALLGDDEAWRGDSRDALALIILFDQVPRNLFRGDAKAFATDARARTLTRHALNHHDLSPLTTKERLFIYIPLQHSEDLHDQQDSCRLYATLNDKQSLDFAERHRAIIAQFGRFPHRNKALGRPSTPEEERYLKDNENPF